jgi:hypothetical protein
MTWSEAAAAFVLAAELARGGSLRFDPSLDNADALSGDGESPHRSLGTFG